MQGQWNEDMPAATAEEIHAAVDKSADDAVRNAERVIEYRRLYPGNAFLTRDQVKALCLRYNLVMAPDFMFAGDIPARNQEERKAFRLHDQHQQVQIGEYDIVRALSSGGGMSGRYGILTLQTNILMPEAPHKPWVITLNSDFALYLPRGLNALLFWFSENYGPGSFGEYLCYPNSEAPIIPVVRTQAGFVHLPPRTADRFKIQITAEPDSRPFWYGSSAMFELGRVERVLDIQFEMRLIHFSEIPFDMVRQMVVCPANMLHDNMAIALREGWEATFSMGNRSPQGRGWDPIILQPVNGGYLVVTRWGAEASLPEVAGQTN